MDFAISSRENFSDVHPIDTEVTITDTTYCGKVDATAGSFSVFVILRVDNWRGQEAFMYTIGQKVVLYVSAILYALTLIFGVVYLSLMIRYKGTYLCNYY